MLTNPIKYNIFEIPDLLHKIYNYCELSDITNFTITCKTYYNDRDHEKIKKARYLIKICYIPTSTVNLIFNRKEILHLPLTRNITKIKFELFKIILNIIIKENKYKVRYLSSLLDILYCYDSESNDQKIIYEWKIYFKNFVNININLIKQQNKIYLWESISQLRNQNLNKTYLTFDIVKNEYVSTK
jgi:hypothetical protein